MTQKHEIFKGMLEIFLNTQQTVENILELQGDK